MEQLPLVEAYDDYTWSHLEEMTQNFSQENFIDLIRFGKLYRGRTKEGKDVTVKIMSPTGMGLRDFYLEDMAKAVRRELFFSEQQRSMDFPGLAKAIGYCSDHNGSLGVVYDHKPLDTLHNLLKNDGIDWLGRMNVAIKLASLLAVLHSHRKHYTVRNIDPAHIMMDGAHNPFLLDLSLLEGGIFGFGKESSHIGGYSERGCCEREPRYADKADVFSFGCVLISLISKKLWERQAYKDCCDYHSEKKKPINFEKWATREYDQQRKKKRGSASLVDNSFKEDQTFNECQGVQVSKLAMRCICKKNFSKRPTMAEVLSVLSLCCREDARMEPGLGKPYDRYTWDDLETWTRNFSKDNFIGFMQSGKLFRGRTNDGRDVTVKIMFVGVVEARHFIYEDVVEVVQRELSFFNQQRWTGNPNFSTLIGYCRDNDNHHSAVVYNLKPVDTLFNLLKNDTLDWNGRMKVAIKLASLLAVLHSHNKPYIVRNINPAHIIIDEAHNPILLDFFALEGGIFGFGNQCRHCIGSLSCYDRNPGEYADRADVFAFGGLLISLISKMVLDDYRDKGEELPPFLRKCANRKRESACSFVDNSLKEDLNFSESAGVRISKLALRCITVPDYTERPTMAGVLCLLPLYLGTEPPPVEPRPIKSDYAVQLRKRRREEEEPK